MAIYKQNIVDVELDGSVHRSFCGTLIGEADIQGDRFGVRCYRNGQEESIAGATVTGYFIRADGSTVLISGAGLVDGNQAVIILPQSCYSVEGAFSLAIKLTKDGVTSTVRIVDGAVARTTTNTVVDPGSVIPDISDLLAMIEDLEEAVEAAQAVTDNIAKDYSDLTFPVVPGQYCLHDSKIYMANQVISASESWTAAHWTEVALADAVGVNTASVKRIDEEMSLSFDRVLKRYEWKIDVRLGRYLVASGFYDDLANYARTMVPLPAGRYQFRMPTGYSFLPVIYVSDSAGEQVLSSFSTSRQTLTISKPFYVNFMKTDTSNPNFTAAQLEDLRKNIYIIRLPMTETLEEKMDLILIGDGGENLFNGSFVIGEMVSHNTGAFSENSLYARTTYLPVRAGKVYIGGNTLTAPATVFQRVAFYDTNKSFVSGLAYTGITVQNANDLYYQEVEAPRDGFIAWDIYAAAVGTVDYYMSQVVPTGYVPYVADSRRINPALIEGGGGSEIVESMTYGKSPSRATRATMTDGQRLEVETNSVMKNQRMTFFAKVSTLDTIYIGHGDAAYGYYIRIDEAVDPNDQSAGLKTRVTYMSNGSTGTSFYFLPRITGFVFVILTYDATTHIEVTIATENGYIHHKSSATVQMSTKGKVFAESDGSSLTNAVMTWDCDDYKKAVWAFGDSYFTQYSNTRWPYYLVNAWGYDTMLLNAYPGEASETALADLQAALTHGTPKYLLWCIGMNDHDSSSAVNADWLATAEAVEALCEAHGIELVYTTIPQVTNTNYNNQYKNAYIRTSGHRYVDLAAAVDGVTGWLSDDGVHPSELGGRLLAAKIVSDFPEIIQAK